MRSQSAMTKIKQFYAVHFVWIGFLLSCAFTVFVVAIEYSYPGSLLGAMSGNRVTIYATLASIGASMLGFVLTAVSVIIVFGDLPRFQLLRESGHYESIFGIFFSAVRWLAILTGCGLIAIFLDTEKSPRTWVSYLNIFLFAISAVRLVNWRNGQILWMRSLS